MELGRNSLVDLPDELVHLSNLETLTLSANKLTHLPRHFGKLGHLKRLDLKDNLELPEQFREEAIEASLSQLVKQIDAFYIETKE